MPSLHHRSAGLRPNQGDIRQKQRRRTRRARFHASAMPVVTRPTRRYGTSIATPCSMPLMPRRLIDVAAAPSVSRRGVVAPNIETITLLTAAISASLPLAASRHAARQRSVHTAARHHQRYSYRRSPPPISDTNQRVAPHLIMIGSVSDGGRCRMLITPSTIPKPIHQPDVL